MKLAIKAPVVLDEAPFRYATAEGVIEIPDEDYDKFKENPKDYINSMDEDEAIELFEDCHFIIENYELEYCSIKAQDVNYTEA